MSDSTIMVEPRYKFAQAEGERIWRELGKEGVPVCLNDIVKALGIETGSMEFSSDSEGYTRVGKEGVIIIYNSKASRTRQRFTVAHEIGHIVLDHLQIDGTSSQLSHRCQEQEAHAFAGALLLPKSHLKEFMKNGDKTLEAIISTYDVSKDVASVAMRSDSRLLNLLKV